MKLLLDQNLSFKLCRMLADIFPDSAQAQQLGLAEAKDHVLWQHARDHDLLRVTHNADFAEMAGLYGPPPKVIWLRCGNQSTMAIAQLLREHYHVIVAFYDDPSAACLEIA